MGRDVDGAVGLRAYTGSDIARRVAEPGKRSTRSAFARDRARVLHSWSLRRLAAKTQVVVPWESDFPRTRLTHSLEVAQIGRELGQALGCDPDLVETAGLAHDLGHPPFGHNGEQALDEVARLVRWFRGQRADTADPHPARGEGDRCRRRQRRAQPDPGDAGRGHEVPVAAQLRSPEVRRLSTKTWPAFEWLREGAPGERRCLEAQVMDWADDIAYSVHDLEDAIHAGHLSLSSLRDSDDRKALIDLTQDRYAQTFEWDCPRGSARPTAWPCRTGRASTTRATRRWPASKRRRAS